MLIYCCFSTGVGPTPWNVTKYNAETAGNVEKQYRIELQAGYRGEKTCLVTVYSLSVHDNAIGVSSVHCSTLTRANSTDFSHVCRKKSCSTIVSEKSFMLLRFTNENKLQIKHLRTDGVIKRENLINNAQFK